MQKSRERGKGGKAFEGTDGGGEKGLREREGKQKEKMTVKATARARQKSTALKG